MTNQKSKRTLLRDRIRKEAVSLSFRVLLVSIAIIIVTFSVYEFIESRWLADESIKLLHTLHFLRGIVSSLLIALIAGLLVFKSAPVLVHAKTESDDWSTAARANADHEQGKYYSLWFVQMRWIAMAVAFSLGYVAVKVTGLLPVEVWPYLLLIIGSLTLLNVGFYLLLKKDILFPNLLVVQVYADLIALTLMLHFSGGIENPLSFLPLIHVMIGGILLSKKQCYSVAAFSTLLFAALAWAEWAGMVNHYTFLIFPQGSEQGIDAANHTLYVVSRTTLQAGLLFLTAFFVTILAEQSRLNKQESERMAEIALAERRLVERALDTTLTGLRVTDLELKSLWMNHWWKEWFGESHCGEDVDSSIRSAEMQTRDDGGVRTTEVLLNTDSRGGTPLPGTGGPRYFQVTTAPLLDREGRISEVVNLAQEITERKRTEGRMVQAGKMAAVGTLAGNVAHEVNNPIAIITGKARLLLSDHRSEMSDKVAGELAKIVGLSDRVARIAQGLLSYCRTTPSLRVPTDVRVPIERALAMVERRATTGNVRIERCPCEAMPLVLANSNEIEQILLNLFLNALDAMPEGGTLCVTCDCSPAEDKPGVTITVDDTGPGIPDEIRQRVFEPFFTTKEEGHGTGLGLSICHGLVRSHGGEIEIRENPEKGTRISIHLPMHMPESAHA